MADWYILNVNVEGKTEDIENFLDKHFDGAELIDETIRVIIDDIDEFPSPRGDGKSVSIAAQQAYDEGVHWVNELRREHPELHITAEASTMHSI